LFTGRLPHEHGVHTHNRDFSEVDRSDTFLERLSAYDALGVSANVWAGSSFGFDGLFDAFSDVSRDQRFPSGLNVARFGQECDADGLACYLAFLRVSLTHDRPLASLANGAVVQLADSLSGFPVPNPIDDGTQVLTREVRSLVRTHGEPFVLFINFMDAHGPLHHVRGYDRSLHEAPLSWRSDEVDWDRAIETDDTTELARYEGLYATAVDYLDRMVVDLIEWLETNTARETTVVVTSDHGDNMGSLVDDHRWGHVGSSLTEGLLHVPLAVVNGPGDTDAVSVTTDGYVSHLRLGDLCVALANEEWPDITADRIFAERFGHSGRLNTVEQHRGTEADRLIRAVYEDDRKYVWGTVGNPVLYQLDPVRACWQKRLNEPFDPVRFADEFAEPAAATKRAAATGDETAAVDDTVRSRLDDLGYI
jgi:arylsulfatase A-like enzyme